MFHLDKDYRHDIIFPDYFKQRNPRSCYFIRTVYLIVKKNNCNDLKWLYKAC